MVRILRVTELVERRRALVAQSTIHRRTMQLELANARYSAALLKRRWTRFRNLGVLGAAAASAAALFFSPSKVRDAGGKGILARVFSGFRMAIGLMALLKKFQSAGSEHPGSEETAPSR